MSSAYPPGTSWKPANFRQSFGLASTFWRTGTTRCVVSRCGGRKRVVVGTGPVERINNFAKLVWLRH